MSVMRGGGKHFWRSHVLLRCKHGWSGFDSITQNERNGVWVAARKLPISLRILTKIAARDLCGMYYIAFLAGYASLYRISKYTLDVSREGLHALYNLNCSLNLQFYFSLYVFLLFIIWSVIPMHFCER